MKRRFLVGGNWKLNGSSADCQQWVTRVNSCSWDSVAVDVVIAPPSLHLVQVRQLAKPECHVAAQNCYLANAGAFTGEISPALLKDVGIHWVILGHSERRELFKEDDAFVGRKVAFALAQGLQVIACIGEKLQEREADQTTAVLQRQLQAIAKEVDPSAVQRIVFAYEPVWAIGTGKVATPEQAQEAHAFIRGWLRETYGAAEADQLRIIYGGSVNGQNCQELAGKQDVDGFLVGGASLKPEFVDIIQSAKSKM